MKIIIIGCGKVGMTLAEQLTHEHYDVVLIDNSIKKMHEISEKVDALTVLGNGSSISTLMDAGVDTADVLIAVTGSDEQNLLCCLIAQNVSKCQTIARVRNPIYNEELNFIRERLGITMTINPELVAAREIARILRFPSAIKIDTFAKGRIELLKFKIRPEFLLNDFPISKLRQKYRCDILVAGVERGDDVFIPDGNFILKDGDYITIITSPQYAASFFREIGMKTNQVKNCMIIGCGTLGYYLAKQLLEMKIKVRIVDHDRERCETLSELLPAATIIHGDGTDRKLLMEEGLDKSESVVTLTNMDEENVLLSLFANDVSSAKVITKVNRISFEDIIQKLDLGSVIYPKYITADYILQYVRAMQNSIGSNVETLYHILDNRAEALEFIIRDNCPIAGIPLMDLALKDNLRIVCINRHGVLSIPRGQDVIEAGDKVIVVTTHLGLRDILDILQLSFTYSASS